MSTDLFINGPIGSSPIGYGIDQNKVVSLLQDAEGPVRVRINSPGGDPMEALAIASALADHGPYDAQVDGTAASAVTIIAAKARHVSMVHGGRFMIHNVWRTTQGDAADHEAAAALLRDASDDVASIYATKTGQRKSAMQALMGQKPEKWMSAQEAKDEGFVDTILDQPAQNCAGLGLFNYSNMPDLSLEEQVEAMDWQLQRAADNRQLILEKIKLAIEKAGS